MPSATRSGPSPKWVNAVEQGRQTVRADLVEQNLPGISAAVGVGGDIVWAEGFGFVDLQSRAAVSPETPFRIGTALAHLRIDPLAIGLGVGFRF